ncbi:MAG: hypothetical protein QOI66_3362 [Myxococcales bacterium]|nr:hypothetical protein [Myxococcales bacterium]
MAAFSAACSRGSDFVGYSCGLPPPLPAVMTDPWNCGPRCFVDENLAGLPGGPTPLFDRPTDSTPGAQPAIVYPLAGSMHPLNLGGIDLQWRRGSVSQAYFRLRVVAATDPAVAYTLYLPCRAPPPIPSPPAVEECTYPISRALWTTIAADNPDGAIDLVMAGTDPAGTTIAQSPAVRIAFGPSSVKGGIYYWSSDGQGIFRALLGGGPGQSFIAPPVAGVFPCGGCHSVSHDGRVLAFSGERNAYSQDGTLAVVAVATPNPPLVGPALGVSGDGATMTLNRDGSLVLVSYGSTSDPGHVVVRETATGRELARRDPNPAAPGAGRIFFPEWSPDGHQIAATVSSGSMRPWIVTGGSIAVLSYSAGALGAPRIVVPQDDAAGLFHFYPTWSPDGVWIAFASAPLPGPSYGNPQSRLRLVGRDGGRVYELAQATQGLGKTSTYPKFAPVMQDQCSVLYLTFNSKLDYGLLLKNSLPGAAPQPQLWMTAIDLRALGSGDPSRPPVWLPFQQTQQSNLLGAWTARIVCSTQADCGPADAAICDTALGECVPKPP